MNTEVIDEFDLTASQEREMLDAFKMSQVDCPPMDENLALLAEPDSQGSQPPNSFDDFEPPTPLAPRKESNDDITSPVSMANLEDCMSSMEIGNIPMALSVEPSFLNGIVMLEQVPKNRLKALIKSGFLLKEWDEAWKDKAVFPNEVAQIEKHLAVYDVKLGGFVTKYSKAKHNWGRVYPEKGIGLTLMRREVRNTLIDGIYYDFDISNAQPEIIRQLCESNNIPCDCISEYCEDREAILKKVQKKYKVSREIAKKLFIRLCFSGTFKGWLETEKVAITDDMPFITDYENELKNVRNELKKVNPALYAVAQNKRATEKKQLEKRTAEGVPPPVVPKGTSVIGSFFGLYNQEYEQRIVAKVVEHIKNETNLMSLEDSKILTGAYEYDGLKLLCANVDEYCGGVEGVIDLLNTVTADLTGFDLKWTNKPYEEKYDITQWLEEEEEKDEDLTAICRRLQRAFDDRDTGVVELIQELAPDRFIYSMNRNGGSNGEWFCWDGIHWENNDSPLRIFIQKEIEEHYNKLLSKWYFKYDDKSSENAIMWNNATSFLIPKLKKKLNFIEYSSK
jgi:hypothetical protein